VSLEVPKEKKETSVQLHREDDIKRSQSLPLIHRPKKSLFQQKRSLGMGDLRQQKIKELKDCINSQILRMDDFQSLKSKILKI
jgi:anti-sigma28 factor (negative regulator of flagellin synthesis)